MKPENPKLNSGLYLDNPRLIVPESSFKARFLFYFFLLLLGISGAYGCFYTAFPIPVSLRVIIPCTVLFSTVFTALFLVKRHRILFLILPVACLSALLFIKDGLMDSLIQGFIRTVNYVIFAYARQSNVDFITLPAKPAGISGITASCTVFAVFLLLHLALLMAWLLIGRKNALLCFLLTIPLLAVPLAFTIIPHYAAVTALLIFWAFLLLHASALRGDNGFAKRGDAFYGDGNMAAHPASFILLPILAACLMLVAALFPMQGFQRSELVEDLRSGLLDRPNMSSLLRSGGVGGNTSRVNLQFAGSIGFTGETVLRVKSSKRSAEYLKGFVGSVYTGQSWEALPEEAYQELNGILNERKVQNFSSLFIRLLRSDMDRGLYEYDLTVQNVGGNPRCIYMPYGLLSEPDDLVDIDFVNDGFLKSGNALFGTKEYGMKATSFQTAYQYTTFYYRLARRFSGNSWRRRSRLAELDLNRDFRRDFNGSIRQMDEWTMPERLAESLSPEQASFARDAQAYTRFVYSHYTQLPEELKARLDQYRQQHDLDTAHFPLPVSLAGAIIDQVHSENAYTLSPGITPSGRDFVEYFLFENHKGYCMHFASATVALLRSAGIPARYAEGYTVSPGDFRGSGGWADIPDSRAHAWAEIYLSGVGWVPVEATPGVQNGIIDHEAAAAASAGESADGLPENEASGEPEASPEPSEAPSDAESSEAAASEPQIPDEAGGAEASAGEPRNFAVNILLRVLSVLAAIGFISLALLINRKLRMTSRNKKFMQEDRNKAAIAIYDYILILLPYTKSRLDLTDKIPKNLYKLVLKARFSQHMLTEQEVRKLLDYAEGLADQARGKAPVFRRFAYEYIYVLF